MSDSEAESGKKVHFVSTDAPSPEARKLVDPLGEIEHLARELHQREAAQGALGANVTWESFWGAAEAQLTAGRSSGVSTERTRPTVAAESLSAQFAALLTPECDDTDAIFLRALGTPLSHHEALCLGHLLCHTTCERAAGGTFGPCSVEDAGRILALVAGEYDEQYMRTHGRPDPQSVSRDLRAAYWTEHLEAMLDADEPLTHADQNTIRRISDLLLREGSFSKAEFVV